MSATILAKGWRVQGVTRCDWGSPYQCLHYSCPGKDSAAQPGRATIIGVECSEVDCLFRHLAFGVGVAR